MKAAVSALRTSSPTGHRIAQDRRFGPLRFREFSSPPQG